MLIAVALLPLTWLCIESCGFVNEEFPAEIQKFAKEQQVLVKLNIAIFNTRCCSAFFILQKQE